MRIKLFVYGAPGLTRTADLLVRSQEPMYFHRLSTGHSGCEALRIVASYQRLPPLRGRGASTSAQHFYAGGGHKTGHS